MNRRASLPVAVAALAALAGLGVGGWALLSASGDLAAGSVPAERTADIQLDPTRGTALPQAGPSTRYSASDPTATSIATKPPTAAELDVAADDLTAFYADQLGVSDADARCVAGTVIGWQYGESAVLGGADKPLADSLQHCGIPVPAGTTAAS